MKEIDDADAADDAEENLDRNQLDPSSISLFSNNTTSNAAIILSNNGISSDLHHFNGFTKTQSIKETNQLPHKLQSTETSLGSKVTKSTIYQTEKKKSSYSSYITGKATEVAKRRNLNERIDKLKSSYGIIFNVPQCHEITLNQLAIFLRRLRKSSNVRQIMSVELMQKIFQEEKLELINEGLKTTEILEKSLKHQTINGRNVYQTIKIEQKQNSNYQAVISVNDLLGDSESERTIGSSILSSSSSFLKQEDDDLTEQSTDDEEIEDEEKEEGVNSYNDNLAQKASTSDSILTLFKNGYSKDRFEFYEKRKEILSADLRALTFYRRLIDTQNKVKQATNSLPPDALFLNPPQTGNEEDDTKTCARCRPLLQRLKKPLYFTDFKKRQNRSLRIMTSHLHCGPLEYSVVDDGIHPSLSLPNAITMERKIQKYLQISSTMPREVERRRHKTAKLVFKNKKKLGNTYFHFADDIPMLEEKEQSLPSLITLNLKKKHWQEMDEVETLPLIPTIDHQSNNHTNIGNRSRKTSSRIDESYNEEDSLNSDDSDYPPRVRKRYHLNSYVTKKNPHKKICYKDNIPIESSILKKQSTIKKINKLELYQSNKRMDTRRLTINSNFAKDDFTSIFDFDASFTDIGLAAVQNVENKEIAIPLFRKKEVIDYSIEKPCNCCSLFDKNSFEKIQHLHETLELQEKQRFKFCKSHRGTRS